MLVIQSYRTHSVPEWMSRCVKSVRLWAESNGYDYHCADDGEILSLLDESFRKKLEGRWPMLTDLGRLKLMRNALENGEERVLWLDADVYVSHPESLKIPESLAHGYAFGREYWLESNGKVREGVHNAICLFERGNPFLDYYIHACERIVAQHSGEHLAPQLLGPKFLKMQNNLLNFELLDSVTMISPAVVSDLLQGDGSLWQKQKQLEPKKIEAVNLCHSLIDGADATAVLDLLK